VSDVKSRSRELSFSSEKTVVQRWFGGEVLDHSPKAVRMDFMNSGRAPLLMYHDTRQQIGVIERASIGGDRMGHATARFGRTATAVDALDNVDDGILTNTSVGYRVHSMLLDSSKDGEDIYRVTDWEPYEASLVTVPADPLVGVGRSSESGAKAPSDVSFPARTAAITEVIRMADGADAAAGTSAEQKIVETGKVTDPVDYERKRKDAIRKLCVANKLDERYERAWVENGDDLNKVADDLIKIINERAKTTPESVAHLDMSKTDTRRYSLMRALRAAANNDWSDAGLELEANKEISKRLDRTPKSRAAFFVPLDILMRNLPNTNVGQRVQRDMTAAGASGSNYLVSTDNQPASFIDLLRNTSVALRMGVTRLGGLKGNVTIPKMTAGNTAYWLTDENTAITESQPTLGQLSLSPKNVAALTEVSHQLISQSTPDAETLLMTSIARDIGLAVDVGILRGSGSSGQPTGIVTTGSIGGFTGTSLAAAGVLDAQADVAAANALYPGCGYVTTPAVAGLLMARPELPSTGTTRLWQGNMLEGSVFGFPAMSSAQMSSATMLFGWWQSVILAEWGVLELMLNPFSDFTRGLSAVRGWYTCDVGVRYAGAWSYASSIT
jgi:HK97 family phage major capsid protein/HK97 family phage prohead protease